jgi:fructose-bisphosphate aldolase class II
MPLPPGVVTGDDYRALVAACKRGRYALPAINVTSTSTVNAVLEAAAFNKSDVIIQVSHGGAQFFAGKGVPDKNIAAVLGAVSMAQHVHLLAAQYGVCVVLHTDHADRHLLPWVDALVKHSEGFYEGTKKTLFSSHMIDLSAESIEDNLEVCEFFLRRMSKIGLSLEMELGVTGGEEDGVGKDVTFGLDPKVPGGPRPSGQARGPDTVNNAHLYTQPADVLRAYDQLSPHGHFSVAASFGNVHGVYAPGSVQLRPEILRASQELVAKHIAENGPSGLARGPLGHQGMGPSAYAEGLPIDNPLDLVFHGGSGSEPDKIAAAIDYGVFKMNIDTDTQFAYAQPVGDYVAAHMAAFKNQIDPQTGKPYKKEYDPRTWLRLGEQGVIARLTQAFTDLRSAGKTLAG